MRIVILIRAPYHCGLPRENLLYSVRRPRETRRTNNGSIHKVDFMCGFIDRPRFAAVSLIWCCLISADARAADQLEWLTNLDAAKQTAAASGKDLFIVFTGSNWCGHCMTLDREDLNTNEFAAVAGDFVLVRLDYLADADNNKVPERLPQEKPAPHPTWKSEYEIPGFPTVYLADPSGRPYAMTGDVDLDAKHFAEHVRELKKTHSIRDAAFAKAEKLTGIERAKAIAPALDALERAFADGKEDYESSNAKPVVKWYREQIDAVIRLDADNEAGLRGRVTDLLNRAALRNEDDTFYDKQRKLGRDKEALDEALRRLDKRIAETKSTAIRNRARRARLVNLEWAKRYDEGLAYARELAADSSYSPDDRRFFREHVAWFLHWLKKDDEALAVYDELIAEAKENPHRVADYLDDKASLILVPAKRYAEALDCCERATKLEKPDTLEWEMIQGRRLTILMSLDRLEEACRICKSLIDSKTAAADDVAWRLAMLAELFDKRSLHKESLDAAARAQQVLKDSASSIDEAAAARVREKLTELSASSKGS